MHLTALPVLLPFLGAVIVLIPWFNKRIAQQRLVAQLFLLGTLAVSIVLFTQTMGEGAQGYAMGEWEAPFGIFLIADPLAGFIDRKSVV